MGLFGGLLRPNVDRLLKSRDQQGLTAALRHDDPTTRWAAVLALNSGEMQPMAWADVVVQLLKDPTSLEVLKAFLGMPEKRLDTLGLLWSTAVKYPAELRPPLEHLTEALIPLLKDHDARVRNFAAKVVGQGGSGRAFEALLATLGDGAIEVRVSAGEALSALGDPRAIESLVAKLHAGLEKHRTTGSEEYRSIVSALSGIRDSRSASALAAGLAWANSPDAEALGHGQSEVESQILRGGLVALGIVAAEPLLDLLQSEHPRVRGEACEVLSHIPDPRAIPALVRLLGDSGSYKTIFGPTRVNERAVVALSGQGEAAKDALTQALTNKSIRKLAAEALAAIRDTA